MNGATALIETLADCEVELCPANPRTSEMHLVQALDATPGPFVSEARGQLER
jgi:acetolactate synthase-1/2/3 large subunit